MWKLRPRHTNLLAGQGDIRSPVDSLSHFLHSLLTTGYSLRLEVNVDVIILPWNRAHSVPEVLDCQVMKFELKTAARPCSFGKSLVPVRKLAVIRRRTGVSLRALGTWDYGGNEEADCLSHDPKLIIFLSSSSWLSVSHSLSCPLFCRREREGRVERGGKNKWSWNLEELKISQCGQWKMSLFWNLDWGM